MKRKYPLFVIDTARTHGRELETDYISCTSKELPFVAEATYITDAQYQKEYDRDNNLVIYGIVRNGFRLRLEVVDVAENYDMAQLRSLLTRAVKEFVKRKQLSEVPVADDTQANKLIFINEMIKQGLQQKRREPGNEVVDQSLAILYSIKEDYERKLLLN